MKQLIKKFVLILLVFVGGIFVGYVLTMWSLFPTAYGNFIFAMAPNPMPYGNDSPAVSAHLSLIHDKSLLRNQTWRYVLSIDNGQSGVLSMVEFTPEQVGGLFRLEHSGSLEWEDDAWAVTAKIGDFVYRSEVPKQTPNKPLESDAG